MEPRVSLRRDAAPDMHNVQARRPGKGQYQSLGVKPGPARINYFTLARSHDMRAAPCALCTAACRGGRKSFLKKKITRIT